MQKLQQEILKEVTRDDGVLNIDKYDHELIEGIIKRAYTAGLERAIEVLPEKEEIGYEEDPYVGIGKLTHNGCVTEAITNITKEIL